MSREQRLLNTNLKKKKKKNTTEVTYCSFIVSKFIKQKQITKLN